MRNGEVFSIPDEVHDALKENSVLRGVHESTGRPKRLPQMIRQAGFLAKAGATSSIRS